jgi:hypothetical protein
MAKMMWFGTRDYMTWVVCPAVNVVASKTGVFTKTEYLSGGANIKRSTNAYKGYELSWEMKARGEIRVITDFADQLFGTGAIYWADPFVMDTNMLPQSVAAPFLGGHDGIILSGKTERPMLVKTDANSYGYPTQSAVYSVGTESKPSTWVPIPPGYTAWVGAHGVAGSGGTVRVTPTTLGYALGTPVDLTLLSVVAPIRVNQSFASSSYDGIIVGLGGSGTVTLSGITVQLLPTGTTPSTGPYISGQGNSGCSFAEQPELTQYNAALDKVGLSVQLVETQQWL